MSVSSAMMNDVVSEIMVESKHQEIHSKPRAILEVRRILVDHLKELTQYPQLSSTLHVPPHWRSAAERPNPIEFNIQDGSSQVVAAGAFSPLPFPEKRKRKLLPIPLIPE